MGACNSADTVDMTCTHNKPYVALCTGYNCSREKGDRRLCSECLVDHMCTDRVTLKDVLENDIYGLQSLLERLTQDADNLLSENISKTIDNFKKHFIDSIKSQQLQYQELVNESLLASLPKEFVSSFPNGAKQITEARNKNDLGQCAYDGCLILLESYRKPEIAKLIEDAIETFSKRVQAFSQVAESKTKNLQIQMQQVLKIVPVKLTRQFNLENPLYATDPTCHAYNFTCFIPSSEVVTERVMQSQCGIHYEQIQVICCDRCQPTEARLCASCLLTHKCNPSLRIKAKSFSKDQSRIIDLCSEFMRKKSDLEDVKRRIYNLFEESLKVIVKSIEESKGLVSQQIRECTFRDIDIQIRLLIPEYAPKLRQVFKNRSMMSLDPRGVQVLVYLIQNDTVRKAMTSNANSSVIGARYLIQLCSLLEEETNGPLQELTQLQNIQVQRDKSMFETLLDRTPETIVINTTNMTQTKVNVTFTIDHALEDRLADHALQQQLNDFGEDPDNHICDMKILEDRLVACSSNGVVCLFQLPSFQRILIIDLDQRCQAIAIQKFNGKLILLVNIATFDSHVIAAYDSNDSRKLFELQGHTEQIWQIKPFNEFVMSCSSDQTIRIWDLNKRSSIKVMSHHKSQVRDIIQINETRITSCSFDKTIQIYDLKLDRIVAVIDGREWLYSLILLNPRAFAVGTGDGRIALYSTEGAEIADYNIDEEYIAKMCLLNDNYLFVASKSRYNFVVRLLDGKKIETISKSEEGSEPEALLVYHDKLLFGDCHQINIY